MLALLFLTTPLIAGEDEMAFFSDDVTMQSEACECAPPSEEEEKKLFRDLDPPSRRLYHSLDSWGKCRAIELAYTCANKNAAVRQAAIEMAGRQCDEYPFQNDYQKQLDRQSGQKPYTERYGY